MSDRQHPRVPYAVEVEFRTASSFLLAYSLNLSRGGLFVETTTDLPIGAPLTLSLQAPDAGRVTIAGEVEWRRAEADEHGPAGLGVRFVQLDDTLGAVIDRLVAGYHGMRVLVLAPDRRDRTALTRTLRSILANAEVTAADDVDAAPIPASTDLALIELDADPEASLAALARARTAAPPVPTVVLTASAELAERARAAGAEEVASNPPAFADLQLRVVRALGRPLAVR